MAKGKHSKQKEPKGKAAAGKAGKDASPPSSVSGAAARPKHAAPSIPSRDEAQSRHVAPSGATTPEGRPEHASSKHSSVASEERPSSAELEQTSVLPVQPLCVSQADAEAAAAELKRRRRKKAGKAAGIAAGVIAAVLVVVYVAGAVVFMGRFLPNTRMGDVDVSLKTGEEVRALLEEQAHGYRASVTGCGIDMELDADAMGLSFDSQAVVNGMLDLFNPWVWPFELANDHDVSEGVVAATKGTALAEALNAAVEAVNAEATPPTDATVAYDEDRRMFAVMPEKTGTQLNAEAVIAQVVEGIAVLDPAIALTDDALVQPAVRADDPALSTAAAEANKLILADVSLTMAGEVAAKVDADSIAGWVEFDENLVPSISDAKLEEWVAALTASHSTIGAERTYTRPDGKQVTVAGGSYGWTVDYDALLALARNAVETDEVATYEMPCTGVGQGWTTAGGKDWGERYCDIDLSEQYVRFYDDAGDLVWESPCITGTPNGAHDTPIGVWYLTWGKASPSKLKGTNLDGSKYESTVQYWMPFDGNVIGLHDADWQAWGAWEPSAYTYVGSHGCVNLPPGKAAELYGIINVDDVVVVHW